MKFKKIHLILAIIYLITGFMFVITIRSQGSDSTTETSRNKAVIELINSLEDQTQNLEASISQIRNQISTIQASQTDTGTLNNMQTSLEQLQLTAGYSQVQGPGLMITLDDNRTGAELAQSKNPNTFNPEYYLIHDKNLLYLVNALANDSEAISINNQRITATSDIRCVGTVIMVNSSRLAPPYAIRVLGNAAALEKVLLNCNEYLALKLRDIPIKITRESNLVLPAYTGNLSFTYARISK